MGERERRREIEVNVDLEMIESSRVRGGQEFERGRRRERVEGDGETKRGTVRDEGTKR